MILAHDVAAFDETFFNDSFFDDVTFDNATFDEAVMWLFDGAAVNDTASAFDDTCH